MERDGFPRVAKLKDGSSVEIALASSADGPALLDFYRSLSDEDRLVLKDDVTTPGWLARFLAKLQAGAATSLVARADGRICGEATLHRNLHGWSRHVGEIRLSVASDRRGKGLGYALAGGVVKLAIDLGLEKMVAYFVESQVAARKTFERLGFRKEAELARQVTDIRGAKRNLLVYSNDVSHIWSAMEALVEDFRPHQGE
ncbi:MAG TPA: GNAT family N-acetyltransferase [Polyangia bacterium]|nr:GNAT family N-acetyltransferase [Polyangia bacterium]